MPPPLLNPPLPTPPTEIAHWTHLHGAALALAIAETAHAHSPTRAPHPAPNLLIIITEDQRQAQILENDLRFFLPPTNPAKSAKSAEHTTTTTILPLPGWECLPYDTFSPPPDIISQRLATLARLPHTQSAILLTTCETLMQRLPPREYVLGHSFALQTNQRIDRNALREKLAAANYAAVEQVISPGEFALRGGLVDIYPMGADAPFRLDLFDDEIESIRYFDPDTQRTNRNVEKISLLPAREFPMTEPAIQQFRQAFRRQFAGDPRAQKIYAEISNGNIPPGAEFFLPLFFPQTATLFDYIHKNALWLTTHSEKTPALRWAEIQDRYQAANHPERQLLPPDLLYLAPPELQQALQTRRRIIHHPLHASESETPTKTSPSPNPQQWRAPSAPTPQLPVETHATPQTPQPPASSPSSTSSASPYQNLLTHLTTQTKNQTRILIATETPGRREALQNILRSHQIQTTPCPDWHTFLQQNDPTPALCVYPLQRGLSLPAHNLQIIAESQLYGEKAIQQRSARKAQDPEAIIRSLAELHEGAPVVHLEHGVGRYRGLKFLDIGEGQQAEFLTLEYRGGSKLYVPILALNLIGRYIGGSPETAPLHRLGGNPWKKAKTRAREKAYDVAAELLEIEALRRARVGQSMRAPESDYQEFASRFPYTETPDQQRAISEVRADLASPQPMDRLVCGDVGFGKTEVALRAAFIAVHNNRQVALLAPTTLLAEQHYQTFTDRFADLPITIQTLSRFKTKAQAEALIAQLKQGKTDIVIGTHRLLQDDIGFARLGLLIIDEEHRFGVRQKEKIKKFRSQVDLLTLTATPIPRTLHFAMSGLRSISLITTAPESRLTIKTFIREYRSDLIREAILREIRRGGQAYFLYNEVRNIANFAEEIATLVPEAEINFAHGKMPKAQLERVMSDFYHHRFNLLICSTIIESGIDIPSVNTILIHRADRFGLAQLHQLRGRVGRSHRQAFAYLFIPDHQALTSNAQKRLEAFAMMDELGAGFSLASHDLEIRGAGELLGETQSGLIDDVGFSLYSEYLNTAVANLRKKSQTNEKTTDGKTGEPSATPPSIPTATDIPTNTAAANVDLHIPALFPPDYLDNPHTRLILYKRIAGALDAHELEELQIEIIDRFGSLPAPGKNLFRLTALRLQAERLGIDNLDIGANGGIIQFTETPPIDVAAILALTQDQPQRYRIAASNTLKLTQDLTDPETRITEIQNLLNTLQQSASELEDAEPL